MLTDEQVAQGRERILRVAERQAVERGIERVSMHSIAQELGWSATALYRYYQNKEAILAATRTAALNQLSEQLEEALDGAGDIWERSRAIGNAYVDFAYANPDTYRLIFALTQPDMALYPDLAAAADRSRRNLTAYAREMVETGDLDIDAEMLAHIFWAQIHGLISLEMTGRLGDDAPDFEAIRHEMVSRIVQSAKRS
ncbi:TetR/AcrR family transcriptional regulator [Sphingomonas oryzagri]